MCRRLIVKSTKEGGSIMALTFSDPTVAFSTREHGGACIMVLQQNRIYVKIQPRKDPIL